MRVSSERPRVRTPSRGTPAGAKALERSTHGSERRREERPRVRKPMGVSAHGWSADGRSSPPGASVEASLPQGRSRSFEDWRATDTRRAGAALCAERCGAPQSPPRASAHESEQTPTGGVPTGRSERPQVHKGAPRLRSSALHHARCAVTTSATAPHGPGQTLM